MATTSKYLANFGKLYIAPRNTSGLTGGFIWMGDVDSLEIQGANERLQFRESHTGLQTKVVDVVTSSDFTFSASLRNIDGDNLAKTYYGTAAAVTGATVSATPVTAYPGAMLALKHPGVSSVVVTKTAGSAVLVANTDYILDAEFGTLTFLTSSTQVTAATPCTVSYTYAGYAARVDAAVDQVRDWALRFEGKSLADQKVQIVEIPRVNFNLATALGLISTEVSALAVEGPILPAPEVTTTGESKFFTIKQA